MSLLGEVVSLLRREKIDHALIGATAMAVHGVSRATVDVDLLTVDARVLEAMLWESLRAKGVSSLAESHEDWTSIKSEVEETVGRLSAQSRRLWKRLRDEI